MKDRKVDHLSLSLPLGIGDRSLQIALCAGLHLIIILTPFRFLFAGAFPFPQGLSRIFLSPLSPCSPCTSLTRARRLQAGFEGKTDTDFAM